MAGLCILAFCSGRWLINTQSRKIFFWRSALQDNPGMIIGMIVIIFALYETAYPVLQRLPVLFAPALQVLFHNISMLVSKTPSKKMPAH